MEKKSKYCFDLRENSLNLYEICSHLKKVNDDKGDGNGNDEDNDDDDGDGDYDGDDDCDYNEDKPEVT